MQLLSEYMSYKYLYRYRLQNQRTGDEPAGGFDSHALPPYNHINRLQGIGSRREEAHHDPGTSLKGNCAWIVLELAESGLEP